ncbi:membrane protein [Sphaerisporangium krabiense]|nr:membrane protein [Sphaerisporangium krabiense]
MAAILAVAGLCGGDAAAGFYPFGDTARSVSDLGNQYVPFYAYFWDVLHGQARGDLFVNWASGFGSSYLPDAFYYLVSPFSLIAAMFPRDRIDLAVYVITVAKIAVAAAVMAWYLRGLPGRGRLRSGLAAVFGAAYALCGWTVTDAAYNPMWLDGLIAFPLLCLAVEWTIARRHPLLATVCVAYAWTSNFYTAYFATIGAAAVLIIRLTAEQRPATEPTHAPAPRVVSHLRTSGRALLHTALGVGLAAPIVLVVYQGAKDAWPVDPRPFVPVQAGPLLGRLLPGSYQFNSPALFVGTFALFAALTLPFNPAVPRRARAVWTATIALVLASTLWEPAVHLWYASTNPNGSYYRQAFVLCGLLVMAGRRSFAAGLPRPYALLGAAAVLGAVIWAASGQAYATAEMVRWSLITVIAGIVLYRAHTLVRGPHAHRHAATVLLALLAAVQTVEAAANVAYVELRRAAFLDDHETSGAWRDDLRAAVRAADRWPAYRTDPGESRMTANDPQLVGGEGAEYYSSMTSAVFVDALAHLGFGWTSRGRAPRSMDNPVTDAVLGVGARAHSRQGESGRHEVSLTYRQAAPLVTVRPGASPTFTVSPYRNQELLLGAQVYELPDTSYLTEDETELSPAPDGSLTTTPDPLPTASYPYALRATCRPGEQVYLHAPEFSGVATLAGDDPVPFSGVAGQSRAPVQLLGVAPPGGKLKIKLRPRHTGRVPAGAVACLDPTRLTRAVDHLRATAPTAVRVTGHTVAATLPPGATGTAVIAAPAIQGWTCSLDHARPRRPGRYLGLLAVPLTGTATTLTCSFTPPGLKPGLLIAGVALVAIGTLYGVRPLLRRRRRTRPGPAGSRGGALALEDADPGDRERQVHQGERAAHHVRHADRDDRHPGERAEEDGGRPPTGDARPGETDAQREQAQEGEDLGAAPQGHERRGVHGVGDPRRDVDRELLRGDHPPPVVAHGP